jgi:uncharacterized protein YqeY
MALIDDIQADLKAAMTARENFKRDTLRLIMSDLKNKRIELGRDLEDEDTLSVITKAKKSRQDSLEQYTDAGREDLAAIERAELEVISGYLPEEMGEDELRELVTAAVAEVGATEPKDMGAVMKALMPKVKGRADGKAVQRIVMGLLS